MKATTQKVSEEEEAKQRPKAKKFAPCTHSQNEKRCPRALLRVEDRSNKWLPLHLQMYPVAATAPRQLALPTQRGCCACRAGQAHV